MPGIHRKLTPSPGSKLAALGALFSVAVIVLFLVDLHGRYWDRIAAAKTDAQSFAKILAEHTVLTFEDVDRTLLEAEAIRQRALSGRDTAPGAANAALRQLQKSSPILIAIGWTDASGDLLAHSYVQALPRRNVSDMSHFIAHRDRADDGLFISPPFRSAVNQPFGEWGKIFPDQAMTG